MGLRFNNNLAFSFVLFVITVFSFLVFSYVFAEITIFYLGLPFALGVLTFSYMLLNPDNKETSLSLKTPLRRFWPCILLILSIVIVVLVPAYSGPILEPLKIPLFNWLRFVASVLLTSFLPGYFLLKILDYKTSIKGWALFVLSYLVSLFVTFLAGFFILVSGNTITLLGMPLALVVAFILMSFSLVVDRKKTDHYETNINWVQISLVFSILTIVIVASAIIMVNNFPLTQGDMWSHQGFALLYSNGFSVHNGVMPSYPYLFGIYQAVLFSLSGLPTMITEQLLYFLSFIPVLAFYVVLKEWFGEKINGSFSEIALFLSTLLGFGSLYALYIKLFNPIAFDTIPKLLNFVSLKTYDISLRTGYLPDIVAPLWNIGIPVFLMLIYLMKKKSGKFTKFSMILILILLGYLGHEAEIVFFVLIYLFYNLLFKKEVDWAMDFSILVGVIAIAAFNLSIPNLVYSLDTSMYFMFTISILILLTSFIKSRGLLSLTFLKKAFSTRSISNRRLLIGKYSKWILLYFYFFALVTWFVVLSGFSASGNFTPFYIFPLRFGILGVLLLSSVILFWSSIIKDKALAFFLFLAFFGFAVEQIANYYEIGYTSSRFAMFAFFGACVLGAYFINRYKNHFFINTHKRKHIFGLLLLIVILPGMLGTVLYYTSDTYYNNHSTLISESEIGALNYVKNNLPSSESILTFSRDSQLKLKDFAGLDSLQIIYDYLHYFLQHNDPSIPLYVLGNSQARYIYINQKNDLLALDNFSPLLSNMLKYLTIAYSNNEVTLYEIPHLSPPTNSSDLKIIYPTQESSLLTFNGINQYVRVNSSSSLNPVNGITLECWVNSKDENPQMIIAKDDFGKEKAQWYLALDKGHVIWTININGSLKETRSSKLVNSGQLYFIAATYENGGGSKIFVNGNLVAEQGNYTGSIKVDNQTLTIGSRQNGSALFFKGNIYGIRVYSRALSTSEQQENNGGLFNNNDTSNILNLPLNEGIGDIAKDNSAFGNDGLILGATWVHTPKEPNVKGLDMTRYMFPSLLGWDYSILTQPEVLPSDYYNAYLNNNVATAIFLEDPQSDLTGTLNWVQNGGKIIVLDNSNSGFFSQLFNITYSSEIEIDGIKDNSNQIIEISQTQIKQINVGEEIKTLEYFTGPNGALSPFILSKSIGSGQIYFVRINPVFSDIKSFDNSELSILKNCFSKIVTTSNISVSTFSNYLDLPDYNCFAQELYLKGNVTIDTNYLSLNEPNSISKIKILSSNLNSWNPNDKIESMHIYGSSRITISNSDAKLEVSTIPSNIVLSSNQSVEVQMSLRNSATLELVASNSTKRYTVQIKDCTVMFSTETFSLQLENPHVEIEGQTLFTLPYIHSSMYDLLAGSVKNLQIIGKASFDVQFSDSKIAFISGFSYSGIASELPSAQSTGKSSGQINWVDVLVSLPNMLAIVFIVLIFSISENIKLRKEIRELKN